MEYLNISDPDAFLPLRDVVFKTLRQSILTGELKPGERLMEIHLAEKLGVSRTPIREAIRQLELEGLGKEAFQQLLLAGLNEDIIRRYTRFARYDRSGSCRRRFLDFARNDRGGHDGGSDRLVGRFPHEVAQTHEGELDVQARVNGRLVTGFTGCGDAQGLVEELI